MCQGIDISSFPLIQIHILPIAQATWCIEAEKSEIKRHQTLK